MRTVRVIAALVTAGGFVASSAVRAYPAAPLPTFSAPVVDDANVVPTEVAQQVDAALADYQRRTGNQVAVAVITTTGTKSLEDYSIDLARAWGVGQKGKDNGVLLLIAVRDRRVRIDVGRGLEGQLTDLQSGRIIRDRLIPLLSQGRYADAVQQGTDAIRTELHDPNVGQLPPPPPPAGNNGRNGTSLVFLVPILLLALALSSLFGRRRRRRRFGWGVPIILGGGWGGGGGLGGGLGGGGFGGGGGGGFGGGGASGGW